MIYFDNAATTKIYDDALTSYVQVSQKFFGNPSSLHQLGVDAFQVLTKARAQVASLFCESEFTPDFFSHMWC